MPMLVSCAINFTLNFSKQSRLRYDDMRRIGVAKQTHSAHEFGWSTEKYEQNKQQKTLTVVVCCYSGHRKFLLQFTARVSGTSDMERLRTALFGAD